MLARLIAEALRLNPNVRTAGIRILEARARLGIAGSTLYPQVQQVTGVIQRVGEQKSGRPDTSFSVYNAGLGIGWKLDFWGKFRRTIESADAGYFASIAQYDDVQVLTAAQVSSLYCSIRTLEARLQIAHENAALQRRSWRFPSDCSEAEMTPSWISNRPRLSIWVRSPLFPNWKAACAKRKMH